MDKTATLTDDELAELKANFDHFDTNHNGTMEARELAKLLTTLGGDSAADELDLAMQALDADSSGTIEFDEFVAWWTER